MKLKGRMVGGLALVLFLGGVGCGATEESEGAPLAPEVDSMNAPEAGEVSSMALTFWEWRLARCGKNTNCGSGVNYDEGFWDKRFCSCHNPYCGSWSCGAWQTNAGVTCGCSSHP